MLGSRRSRASIVVNDLILIQNNENNPFLEATEAARIRFHRTTSYSGSKLKNYAAAREIQLTARRKEARLLFHCSTLRMTITFGSM